MKNQKLKELKESIELLINGVDPLSKISFEADSILSSRHNKNILKDVVELIDLLMKLSDNPDKIDKRNKSDFYIAKDEREKIPLSDTPIPISTFTYTINEQIDTMLMKKLRATQITTWLFQQGYLSTIEHDDGKVFKVLTDKSSSIGLSSKEMINAYGRQYSVILYNSVAQKFIVDHLDMIVD